MPRKRMRWMPVVGYEGSYLVSDTGIVRSKKTLRDLKQTERNGYLFVNLRKEGKNKFVGVHRIVCAAFNGPPEKDNLEVDHLNFDRADNRPQNLEWVDHKENRVRASNRGRAIIGTSKDGARVYFPDALSLEEHCFDFTIINRIIGKGIPFMGFVWEVE